MSAPAAAPAKKTKAPKKAGEKKAPSHPTYAAMIKAAIKNLKEHKGSSKQAIFKYILTNYKVGSNAVQINSHLRLALKRGVASGMFTQPKGIGASGRFRLSESAKAKKAAKPKSPKKKAVKKTGAKKTASPKKKAGAKKTAAKKTKSPKKAKSPKKPKAAKKPKATKPKSPKKASPKKKVAKKAPAASA